MFYSWYLKDPACLPHGSISFQIFVPTGKKNPNNPDSLNPNMLHIVDCRPYDSLGDVPGYSDCELGRIPVTPFENKDFLLS